MSGAERKELVLLQERALRWLVDTPARRMVLRACELGLALEAELQAREQVIERLREYVVAHTLVEKGVVDFDLHAEAVERLRRAQDSVADVVRAALTTPDTED